MIINKKKGRLLTKKERVYLRNLLNKEVEDFSKPYYDEIYTLQEKLELYPAKERMQCEKCREIFLNTRMKKGKDIFLAFLRCKKCRCKGEYP